MQFNNEAFLAGLRMTPEQRMSPEEQLAQKMQLMEHQARLRDQAMTSEEKGFNDWLEYDPDTRALYESYRKARDPYGQDRLGLQQYAASIQAGQLGLAQQRLEQQVRESMMSPEERRYMFLIRQGVPQQQAMDQAFGVSPKDQMMRQFLNGQGGGAAPAPSFNMPK